MNAVPRLCPASNHAATFHHEPLLSPASAIPDEPTFPMNQLSPAATTMTATGMTATGNPHDVRSIASEPSVILGWMLWAIAVAIGIACFGGCASLSAPSKPTSPGRVAAADGCCPDTSCPQPSSTSCPQPSSPGLAGSFGAQGMNASRPMASESCHGEMGMGSCGCGPAPMAQAPIMPVVHHAFGTDPNEFLCNGGDQPPTSIVRRDDSIAGLNPTDTVVHYTTEGQDIELSASNPVCLYAPRFASVRKITAAVSGHRAIGLSAARRRTIAGGVEIKEGGVVVEDTTELAHAEVTKRIDAMRDRNRGVPVDAVQQVVQAVDVLAALAGIQLDQLASMSKEQHSDLQRYAVAAVRWTLDQSVEAAIGDVGTPAIKRAQAAEGFTVYDFPEAGRLEILKLADRQDAVPGETVSFAITVRNVGDSPVHQVTLADSLTTRLEYVAESQTCSGGADFETSANEVGSERLTWTLTDELKVGESVTIRFQCKVR